MVKFTWTEPTSNGWHMGMRSAVRFAAWIPAILAVPSTSPLVMALLATLAVVSGAMSTRQRASARRWVGSFGTTSTTRAPPSGSRWARPRSDTGESLRHEPGCQEYGELGGGTAGRGRVHLALEGRECQRSPSGRAVAAADEGDRRDPRAEDEDE